MWGDWRSALLSVIAGTAWQLLITYPSYLPSAFFGSLVLLLVGSYLQQPATYPIQAKPSFLQLCCVLFLPRRSKPLEVTLAYDEMPRLHPNTTRTLTLP